MKRMFILTLILVITLSGCTSQNDENSMTGLITSNLANIPEQLASHCSITKEISCQDFIVSEDKIYLKLNNDLITNLNNPTLKITDINTGNLICDLTCTNCDFLNEKITSWMGENCNTNKKLNEMFEANIVLTYFDTQQNQHIETGTLKAQVKKI